MPYPPFLCCRFCAVFPRQLSAVLPVPLLWLLQNTGLCFGNFKIRMPVQRPFPVGQLTKFILKKGNRKSISFPRDLFTHGLVYNNRHKNLLSFDTAISSDCSWNCTQYSSKRMLFPWKDLVVYKKGAPLFLAIMLGSSTQKGTLPKTVSLVYRVPKKDIAGNA